MRRFQVLVVTAVVLAGVAGGGYALARAFGVGSHRHVAGIASGRANQAQGATPSAAPPSAAPAGTGSGSGTPLCSDQTALVRRSSQQGAAGTISTVWRVTNTSQSACHTYGYPGMDFRAGGRWLNVQVQRGGFPNINQPPSSIVVPAGQSLFFVSYWNDVQTTAGPCRQFDRLKVTLPDNTVSAQVAASGCLTPTSVRVGPVTRTQPS